MTFPKVKKTLHFVKTTSNFTQPNIYLMGLCSIKWASLVAHALKNSPAMQETHVGFLGQQDPWEYETATHSNILAWEIPWTEEPGRL